MFKIPFILLFVLLNCGHSSVHIESKATSNLLGRPIYENSNSFASVKQTNTSLDRDTKFLEDIESPTINDEIDDQQSIEHLLHSMTLDEKIGQLFWVAVHSNKGRSEINATKQLIQNQHIGGIVWFRNTKLSSSPTTQLRYTNELQSASKHPLIVSIDGEWGLNMRLDSTIQFPRQLTLGAIQDDQKIYEFGKEVGRQMKRMGIHVNFAPVIDVNNNINNPVINDRSFGEDIYNVANKGVAYMNGMHDAGILATAKHFPGHGDTDTDSHLDLPVIYHPRNRLDSIELYPFKQLIQARIGAVMVAHLHIPALDNTPNRPTTLSKKVVTSLLQEELGYDGLVITDAMNMRGVTKHFASGQAEVEALLAGNDVILYSANVIKGIGAIKEAVSNGKLSEDRINKSVYKILSAKRWLGILDKHQELSTSNVVKDLNQPKAELLNETLYAHSTTLVHNYRNQLPFTDLSSLQFATVSIGNGKQSEFQNRLSLYAPMKHFALSMNASKAEFDNLISSLNPYNTIIIGVHNQSRYASRGFGISEACKQFVSALQEKSIVTLFGNPYSLQYFSTIDELIVAYDDGNPAQIAAAESIFGVHSFRGKTPVSVPGIPYKTGIHTVGNLRIKHTRPEALGYPSDVLYQVDSIALDAIAKGATPGCQILIAKDNQVIYNKSFGYFTDNKQQRVTNSDVYDVASITKIAASMPILMKNYEKGLISLDMTLAELHPDFAYSNKKYFKVGEILNHTSGLKAWIPFYVSTLESGRLNHLYRTTPANGYQQVAKNIYIHEKYEKDSILHAIKETDNRTPGTYKYSDLGFYIFKNYFERLHNKPFEQQVDEEFYNQIGFPSLTYNPLNKFSISKIVPSEKDNYYRNQTVRGYVHDMGAAMQGGVGGHAGLFANTNDLAIYMQMLLNKGYYGGIQHFNSSTIELFTRRYNQNSRKGLGFDKPELDPNKIGPTCIYVSPDSFGHTGFTGTFAWADPQNNIIMIFLSNRTYPTQKNRKLLSMNVRPQIQEAAWKALDPSCKAYY